VSLISDRDFWAAALLIVKRYGDDAMLEAAERLPAWRIGDAKAGRTSLRLVVGHRLRVGL
jgi:hypothetical protein